jgi:hypothetical protein
MRGRLDVSKVPFGPLGVSKGTFMAWTCGVWLLAACLEGHLGDGERTVSVSKVPFEASAAAVSSSAHKALLGPGPSRCRLGRLTSAKFVTGWSWEIGAGPDLSTGITQVRAG